MAGGRTASASLSVTGDAELDAALVHFDKVTVRKWIRTALNEAVKVVEEGYRALCPVETGAMRDATVRRTPRGLKRGTIGRALIIVAEKLYQLHEKRGGGNLWYRRKGKKKIERFFYPAVVELGDKDTPARRPLRAALYGGANHIRQLFIENLRKAVAEAERKKNAVSLEASTEMAWALGLEGSGGEGV